MKKTFLLLLIIFSVQIFAQNQKESIEYYFTYQDYLNNKPTKASIIIKEKFPNSIKYENIISSDTGNKVKKSYNIWAIKYNGELYTNLASTNYEIWKDHAFGKFNIVGKRLNVVILDTKKDRKSIGANGNPYGGGLIATALYKPNNSEWKDKKGNTYKVLFYDAFNPFMSPVLKENVMVRLLTAKDLAEFYNNDPEIIEKLKKDQYYLEDFLDFAKKQNE